MGGMDHSGHAMPAMDHNAHAMHAGMAMAAPVRAHHARTEYGPSVDMRVDFPRTNLDDPGIGLRDRHGATLVLVTHAPDLAARCDRVVHLDDGRIASTELRAAE